jgi:hypothetical protein
MNSTQLVLLSVVVVAVAVVGYLAMRKYRSQKLREKFGPEYDRVIKSEGGVRQGEGVLEFREKRRKKLAIRPLPPEERNAFAQRWDEVQSRFVDDPKSAVTQADGLVTEVMQARGYPMGDFEQRAADISVDHPVVVDNYRAAREIALRHGQGKASTEDMRKAIVHYRALFTELLEQNQPQRKGA